jgi:hypothetical protein
MESFFSMQKQLFTSRHFKRNHTVSFYMVGVQRICVAVCSHFLHILHLRGCAFYSKRHKRRYYFMPLALASRAVGALCGEAPRSVPTARQKTTRYAGESRKVIQLRRLSLYNWNY